MVDLAVALTQVGKPVTGIADMAGPGLAGIFLELFYSCKDRWPCICGAARLV